MLSKTRLAAVFAVVALAGCGGSDSGGGGSAGAASQDTVEVSAADLQKTVDQAMSSTDVKATDLPELMRDSMKRATPELTKAQMDKAYECWKATECTLGDGKLTVAQADPFGGNTWRQFTKMNVILEALTHPEVGKFVYTDANFDLATWQANLRTLTAQGADVIVTNNEFGPAGYSALATAQRQGAKVATYVGAMDDAPESTYTTRVQWDVCGIGKSMAGTAAEVADGPVAFLEGFAGNPQDAETKRCIEEAGGEVAFSDATDYTPAGTQKAAAALIASGKDVKAILYSYANTVPSIVKAYQKAGKPVPAIVTLTQANAAACQRTEDPYPLYVTNSVNWASRVAANAAIQAAGGEQVDRSVVFPLPFTEVTDADCLKDKPAEYPGPALVPDALGERMLSGQ